MTNTQFDLRDDDVFVVIGSGAGGGTLANELCQRGHKVVCLEAGPLVTRADIINDAVVMDQRLTWTDGHTGQPLWVNKCVGGSTMSWGGVSLRLKDYEFCAHTIYGNVPGATLLDWPLTYGELAPYYDKAEAKMGVTGTHDLPLLPKNNTFLVMEKAAKNIGYTQVSHGHLAINSIVRDGRSACMQLGFCYSGCKVGAKWCTSYTEITQALETKRLDLRPNCMAMRIEHDDRGLVSGVLYQDPNGAACMQRAKIVCIAGNSIETPRILLNSSSRMFPTGLANSSGQVGKNYMKHVGRGLLGLFKMPINAIRGTTNMGCIEDEWRHDPNRGFVSGYLFESMSLHFPLFAAGMFDGWGRNHVALVDAYSHAVMILICGEDLPQERNQVRLHADRRDAFGLPAAEVTQFHSHTNDDAMWRHGITRVRALLESVGAMVLGNGTKSGRAGHNLGTCRMSASPNDGVCNKWGQSHDVRNLFISDGSQFTTSGAPNPTLTIVALAMRQADYIHELAAKGSL